MTSELAVEDSRRARAPAEDPVVGRVIAHKFKLCRLLGAGGMGAVYEAEDLLMRRRVAIKRMKPGFNEQSTHVQRFIREARAADSIQHRNIVRVYDLAASEDGAFFIVQELLSGESLSERLDRVRKLSSEDALAVFVPVFDALHAAHERGVIHRDIKPDNVFLHCEADGTETPKLIDFGISKSVDAEGLARTQTGTALGTPYYMSPEQVRGSSSIDHRADLWSAGVMLFEALTGHRPFVGENYHVLILKIMTDRAPRACDVDPSVSRAVSEVLASALEPGRDRRFASARAMREAFEAAIRAQGGSTADPAHRPSARRSLDPGDPSLLDTFSDDAGPHGRADPLVPSEGRSATPEPVDRTIVRPPPRSRAVAAGGLALLLLGAGMAVAVGVTSRPEVPPRGGPAARPVDRPRIDPQPALTEPSPGPPPATAASDAAAPTAGQTKSIVAAPRRAERSPHTRPATPEQPATLERPAGFRPISTYPK